MHTDCEDDNNSVANFLLSLGAFSLSGCLLNKTEHQLSENFIL